MVNQSCVDLIASTLIILRKNYTYSYIASLDGLLRQVYCRVFLTSTLHIALFASSGYNLVALSLERYAAITDPLTYDEEKVGYISTH